ncbi:MAG: hypothetical protein KBA81_07245 [Rhabdochlamydiaceae bacterium]|nr:hypothetical protein [Rhabdochlamydiaceae bacterium]
MSLAFDAIAGAISGISYYRRWDIGITIASQLLSGVECFSVVSLVDRCMKRCLSEHKAAPAPLLMGLFSAITEEAVYAKILQTEERKWMPFRLLGVLILGMTAAKALIQIPKEAKPPTLDLQIGVVWALTREVLLQTLPSHYSRSILLATDGCLFAFCELKFDYPTKAKVCKFISACCFRVMANQAALNRGFVAALTQHVLFNISRSLDARLQTENS